jgi:hypothetical protein
MSFVPFGQPQQGRNGYYWILANGSMPVNFASIMFVGCAIATRAPIYPDWIQRAQNSLGFSIHEPTIGKKTSTLKMA